MPAPLSEVLEFLEERRVKEAEVLPQFGSTKVVSYLGTTAEPGQPAAMGVRRLAGVGADPDETALHVVIGAALPRVPGRGDRVALSLTQASWFKGYQVKTFAAGRNMPEQRLFGPREGGTVLYGQHVYTVHPGPATASFFEQIPYADVAEVARELAFAVVAVGHAANIAPRFIYHHEVRDGRLVLFQGDVFMNKTFLNLQQSKATTHLIFDPASLEGFTFTGTAREISGDDEPEGMRHVLAGFTSAGMKPNRIYCVDVERWVSVDARS